MAKFTPKQKLEAVLAAYSHGQRRWNKEDGKIKERSRMAVTAISRQVGISPALLTTWAKKLDEAAEEIFEHKNGSTKDLVTKLSSENKKLRRRLRVLKTLVLAEL